MTMASSQGLPILSKGACLAITTLALPQPPLSVPILLFLHLWFRFRLNRPAQPLPTTKGLLLAMNAGQARHIERRHSNAMRNIHSILQQVFLTVALMAQTCVSQCLFLTTNIPASASTTAFSDASCQQRRHLECRLFHCKTHTFGAHANSDPVTLSQPLRPSSQEHLDFHWPLSPP